MKRNPQSCHPRCRQQWAPASRHISPTRECLRYYSISFRLDADGPARNKIAAAGLDGPRSRSPAAFFRSIAFAAGSPVGNFDDDLKRLADVDWIIEAIVENLENQALAAQEGGSDPQSPARSSPPTPADFRWRRSPRDFPLTSGARGSAPTFSIPPRYMRLLELIPTQTRPRADRGRHALLRRATGQGRRAGERYANFIANRIGTFSVLNVMRLMQEMDLTIEEIDALTGQAVGWPRSATFRTIDLVGLDILGHVVRT